MEKIKLLIYYYMFIPIIDICILLIQSNQTQPIIRYFFYILIFWILLVTAIMNTILSSLSLAINDSYPLLFGLLAKHSLEIYNNLKLKLINLIEKLSKKRIGFTCNDCFTFCYFELFVFYVNLVLTYILIYGLNK
jgi:hypothetical protein